jgi:hypothetical protein
VSGVITYCVLLCSRLLILCVFELSLLLFRLSYTNRERTNFDRWVAARERRDAQFRRDIALGRGVIVDNNNSGMDGGGGGGRGRRVSSSASRGSASSMHKHISKCDRCAQMSGGDGDGFG